MLLISTPIADILQKQQHRIPSSNEYSYRKIITELAFWEKMHCYSIKNNPLGKVFCYPCKIKLCDPGSGMNQAESTHSILAILVLWM